MPSGIENPPRKKRESLPKLELRVPISPTSRDKGLDFRSEISDMFPRCIEVLGQACGLVGSCVKFDLPGSDLGTEVFGCLTEAHSLISQTLKGLFSCSGVSG